MSLKTAFGIGRFSIGMALAGWASAASADLIVNQLVVELGSNSRTADVELFNDSDERSYVVIEPGEIVEPGTANEHRVTKTNPKDLGLLVSANRLILEPGQRRLLRLAAIGIPADRERVYRVAVKPVVGEVNASITGLKLLVGYDMLVLVKPGHLEEIAVRAVRKGPTITLFNDGNSSVELSNGEFCRAEKLCQSIPGKRIYAGASWTQSVGEGGKVTYKARSGQRWIDLDF